MTLPDDVRAGVERALSKDAFETRIDAVTPTVGGCINHGARVVTDGGVTLFLKWNESAPPGMFTAEVDGLAALRSATSLRIPAPVAVHDDGDGTPWLLMDYVAPGPADGLEAQTALGQGLAQLHGGDAGTSFGWERDNWIGSLEQLNEPSGSWADYWRDRRLKPQLARARARGLAVDRAFDDVLETLPVALEDVTRPELLHGDLWGGNWFADTRGQPVLIDPAVYRGHGEVDLAMSELFGGFGPGFYDAYADVRGRSGAYDAYRRDLYQLYYLLVHVNLFGRTYEAGSTRAARRVLAALR